MWILRLICGAGLVVFLVSVALIDAPFIAWIAMPLSLIGFIMFAVANPLFRCRELQGRSLRLFGGTTALVLGFVLTFITAFSWVFGFQGLYVHMDRGERTMSSITQILFSHISGDWIALSMLIGSALLVALGVAMRNQWNTQRFVMVFFVTLLIPIAALLINIIFFLCGFPLTA